MKCNVCEANSLPESPAKIILDNGEQIEICDECERLLSVINEKMNELLDEPLSAFDMNK